MKTAAESKLFSTKKTLNVRGRLLDLATPAVMGILNVTPDSFYDGGRLADEASLLRQAEQMLEAGATWLDVGGYSTRPGAAEVPEAEERRRVTTAIEAILKRFPQAHVSVDTFRSQVARAAVEAGAAIINDVSGGALDDQMFATVAALKVPYILMHMRGTPQTMTSRTNYQHLTVDILRELQPALYQLNQLGVTDICVDPGFGFAKTVEQNFSLLHHLDDFQTLGRPLLVGLSRKSMIWRTLHIRPDEALNGTTALHALALWKGADILRVHDVKEAVQVVSLVQACRQAALPR